MLRRDPHRPSESELAALADGSLAGRRRAQVAAVVADSPELQSLVEEQRRTLSAIDAVAAPAPSELRARLAGIPSAPALRRRRPFAPALGVACAIAVALAVVLSTLGPTAPTVAQAAALALRPVTATAPAAGNRGALLPAVRAAGLPYPYWEDRFGWRASGIRHDSLSGRPATTVFYRRAGQRLGYTIVSGPALATPRTARVSVSDGTRIAIFGVDGQTVATWLRHGHSCVLSGSAVPGEVLVRLAGWRGRGRIPY